MRDALLLKPSLKAQAPTIALLGVFLLLYPVLAVAGVIPTWLMLTGILVFGFFITYGVLTTLRTSRAPWELSLDPSGVTVYGNDTVPWSDLVEVRVSGMKPRWMFWLGLGYKVVAFVPRAGIELPGLPSTSHRGRLKAYSHRKSIQHYGSPLLVMPYATSATVTDILAGVRSWSDVPVRGA